MSFRNKIFLFLMIAGLAFVFVAPVFAQGLVPCGTKANPEPCNVCDLLILAQNIQKFVIGRLLPAVGGLMFIVGGVLFLLAGADQSKAAQGKSLMTNTAIGIAIIFASYMLTNSILVSLAGKKNVGTWYTIKCTTTITPETEGGGGGTKPDDTKPDGDDTVDNNPPPKNPTSGNPLAIARAELAKGVKEVPRASNSGPEVDKYFKPGGAPGQSWCAYFVTWVYAQAGHPEVLIPNRGGSLTLLAYFQKNQTFISLEDIKAKKSLPQPGDIAFFDRGISEKESTGDGQGHVSIVESYNPATEEITTIDGNIGHSMNRNTRNINVCSARPDNSICGFFGVGRIKK